MRSFKLRYALLAALVLGSLPAFASAQRYRGGSGFSVSVGVSSGYGYRPYRDYGYRGYYPRYYGSYFAPTYYAPAYYAPSYYYAPPVYYAPPAYYPVTIGYSNYWPDRYVYTDTYYGYGGRYQYRNTRFNYRR